jgi:hypothetical protein
MESRITFNVIRLEEPPFDNENRKREHEDRRKAINDIVTKFKIEVEDWGLTNDKDHHEGVRLRQKFKGPSQFGEVIKEYRGLIPRVIQDVEVEDPNDPHHGISIVNSNEQELLKMYNKLAV